MPDSVLGTFLQKSRELGVVWKLRHDPTNEIVRVRKLRLRHWVHLSMQSTVKTKIIQVPLIQIRFKVNEKAHPLCVIARQTEYLMPCLFYRSNAVIRYLEAWYMITDQNPFGFLHYRAGFGLIFKAAKRLEPGRTGGYICVADSTTGTPLALSICGEMDEERAAKCCRFVQEKARRLGTYPQHFLSYETRDVDAEMYGGAVRASQFIFSFSGFSEETDEAMMIELAVQMRYITEEGARQMTLISGNEVWQKLRQEMSVESERKATTCSARQQLGK